MFVVYPTNVLARKCGKLLCVETLGELVKAWREESKLTQPQLARLIGHGVKYQNIQQLESGQAKQPKYLVHLAKAMGTTVDDLLALRRPPPYGSVPPAAEAPQTPGDYQSISPMAAEIAEWFDNIPAGDLDEKLAKQQRAYGIIYSMLVKNRWPVPSVAPPAGQPKRERERHQS